MKTKYLLLLVLFIFSCVDNSKKENISELKKEKGTTTTTTTTTTTKEVTKIVLNETKQTSLKENIIRVIEEKGYLKKEVLSKKRFLDNPRFGKNLNLEFGTKFLKDKNYLDMIIYKYSSVVEAETIFNEMYKLKNHEDGVFKNNNIVINDEEFLIWIKSGCSLPKSEWNTFVPKIKTLISNQKSLYCYCGGFCD